MRLVRSLSTDPKRSSMVTGAFLRNNFASDEAEQAIESVGLPPYNNDIRLRYVAPIPLDINSQGQVLAFVRGYYEWNPGVPGHVYPPGGGDVGPTFFPNDPGHFWWHPDYNHNVIRTGGSNYDIPRPALFYYFDYTATGLNDSGEVLFNATAGYPSAEPGRHVLVWQGAYRDLGVGFASKINRNGDVAGYKEFVGGGVWRDDQFTQIGDQKTVATSLNDAGHVIGYADRSGIYNAWVWKDGEKLDLGPGIPTCINNKGQIASRAIRN